MKSNQNHGRWEAGESGNPKGRTPGTGRVAELRERLSQHVPEIIELLVLAVRNGDLHASRLILQRVIPPIKAVDLPQAIPLPAGSLTEQGHAIVTAVSTGTLAPGYGAQLPTALGSLSKIAELDEMAARITALEKQSEQER